MDANTIQPTSENAKPSGQTHDLSVRRQEPVIQVDGSLGTYYVNVRPCPPFLPSLEHYHGIEAALARAGHLGERYGWKIAVICDEADGAA
jgi:hypothetical protein